ncbi:MAG: Holliday junction branch migration protein RuvA [Clostridia bacterium]|nr:Holliday junction branch migration protein RuvA [Clostridia bacterium]
MFYYISGTLAHLDLNTAVVDAGGVGYKMTISQMTYSALPHQNTESTPVKLYTHLSVREDGIELYGFGSAEELESFQLLITVSGVGPKAAIAILSQLTPSRLVAAICADDKKAIAAANGIGPKTAARIILELKDKLQKIGFTSDDSGILANEPTFVASSSSKRSDALEALMALGYSKNEATAVLKTIDVDALELDDIIRLALKKIMK